MNAQQGGTPSKVRKEYWSGHIPFVTAADLTEHHVDAAYARSFLTTQGLNSGAAAICEPGSLLLATRTRVGKISVADELMGASQDITVLTPHDFINPSFLYWVLKDSAAHLQVNTRGTCIQGVTRDDVDSLLINLPPLYEQRVIAAVLSDMDSLTDALDALIDQEAGDQESHHAAAPHLQDNTAGVLGRLENKVTWGISNRAARRHPLQKS